MHGYAAYMKSHPIVSLNRAEKLMSEGPCFFVKEDGRPLALLPGSSSQDDLVLVDLEDETCQCNVYRTKRGCPHIAAALGIVERNGGRISYTDPVPHVYACLEKLKKRVKPDRCDTNLFLRNIRPFLCRLSKVEKPQFLLALGEYLQMKDVLLTQNEFLDCYDALVRGERAVYSIAEPLYQNRRQCMKAVAALLSSSYYNPFTKEQISALLPEITADPSLAAESLQHLVSRYADAFGRKQLVDYYATRADDQIVPHELRDLLNRLLREKPPMLEEFLGLLQRFPGSSRYFDLDPSILDVLVKAGYGDRLGPVVDQMVYRMKGLDDYFRIIQTISHDQFLSAWRKRQEAKNKEWHYAIDDWEIEIEFREDPEADPEAYYMEELDCRTLGVIGRVRPAFQDAVNQAARKKFRRAAKEENRKQMAEALMLLVQGKDAIAVKYASGMKADDTGDTLVYLAATGMRFDCLETLASEIHKLEAPYAAG